VKTQTLWNVKEAIEGLEVLLHFLNPNTAPLEPAITAAIYYLKALQRVPAPVHFCNGCSTAQVSDPNKVCDACRNAAPKDDVTAVIAERGKVYGDPSHSHVNIGLEWTGLIQQHYGLKLDHPLPGWLVELMMVTFKCHRAARVFHQDNYTDAKAYLSFAEKDQQETKP
jgi:hypothetical protein